MRQFLICAIVTSAWIPGSATAHLMVTEVGYDVVDETAPTAEFVEIMNPGAGAVLLGNIWLATDEEAYPLVVNGPLSSGVTLLDFLYRFPDMSLGAGRVLVVCQDSDAFLAEHFNGSLQSFLSQSGSPVLLETTQDGIGDGVADMIDYGSNPPGTLSMANNGECVGLVAWDGAADRVADLDWVCWLHMNRVPNKDVDYPFGIDGPDSDFDSSFFLEDLGTGTPAPDAAEETSIHRVSLTEAGEVTSGGNGVTGHDETSEDWSSWTIGAYSPGVAALATVDVAPPHGALPGLVLLPAEPNPFNASTRIRFTLPSEGRVRLAVLDVSGRRVARVAGGWRTQGQHMVVWNGRGVGGQRLEAGVYALVLEFEGQTIGRKLLLLP